MFLKILVFRESAFELLVHKVQRDYSIYYYRDNTTTLLLLRRTYRGESGEVLRAECTDIELNNSELTFKNYELRERGNERVLLEFTVKVNETPWFLEEDRLKFLIKKSGVVSAIGIIEEVALYLFKL